MTLAAPEARAPSRAFTIQYEINDACNLRCSHCYHGTKVIKEGAIGLERLLEDIEGLKAVIGHDYQIVVRMSGGEVLLKKNLMDLLTRLLIEGHMTVLLTNGTLVNADTPFELMLRGVRLTQISLDGPTAELHEAIRGKGQFAKALAGIRHLHEAGMPVSTAYTLMAGHNDSPEDFDALFTLARAEGLAKVNFTRMFPQGDGLTIPQYAYADGLHYKAVLESLLAACARFPDVQVVIKDPLVRNLEAPIPSNVKLDVCCYIKKDYISVAANGEVFACRKLGKPVGNLLEQTLADIWQSGALLQQMADRRQYMEGKCRTCPINTECQGGCLAASHGLYQRLFVPDPACWREEPQV
jgi:radical SAM protein with 4Fe4S-binding SPASM domain